MTERWGAGGLNMVDLLGMADAARGGGEAKKCRYVRCRQVLEMQLIEDSILSISLDARVRG